MRASLLSGTPIERIYRRTASQLQTILSTFGLRCANRFDGSPNLYAEVVNRAVMGDYVIDHEKVSGLPNGEVQATVIFHVSNHEIDKVWFIIEQ